MVVVAVVSKSKVVVKRLWNEISIITLWCLESVILTKCSINNSHIRINLNERIVYKYFLYNYTYIVYITVI